MKTAIIGDSKWSSYLKAIIPNNKFYRFESFAETIDSKKSYDFCFVCFSSGSNNDLKVQKMIKSIKEIINSELYILCFEGTEFNQWYSDISFDIINDEKSINLSFFPNSSILKQEIDKCFVNAVIGGEPRYTHLCGDLLMKQTQNKIKIIYTTREFCELSKHIENFWLASQTSIANDLYNICGEFKFDYNIIRSLYDFFIRDFLSKYNIDEYNRGYSDECLKDSLNFFVEMMSEKGVHHYFADGIIRSNNFNIRKSEKYTESCQNNEKIEFYNIDQPYGFLSNFSDHPIFCHEKIWKTVEHYYQAQKFIGTEIEDLIRLSYNPMKAKEISKSFKSRQISNWPEKKEDIMYEALIAKFTQHPELKIELIKTGNRELLEHTCNDSYWGDGGDGTGRNTLGKLLMRIRKEIKY